MGDKKLLYVSLFILVLGLSEVQVFGSDHDKSDNSKEKNKSLLKLKEESTDEGSYITYIKYKVAHSEFLHGFIASLSMIIVSELGDKTFFIAAIMAMRHSRAVVLAGALGALVAMTILSALLGYATTIIPRQVTYYASSILFLVFGVKMIKDGWYMSPDEAQEEYEEAQAEIKKKEDELFSSTQDIETGIIRGPKRNILTMLFSAIFIEAFVLTFLAEWGDRSQIATIILAAREDVVGVIIGGCLGHALCTGLAVLGGRIVAQKISARTVTIAGGIVFIIFAVTAFLMGPD
ncbi:transmembrane protein 165-like [Ruditapes philippinarum]|uniref:transmembrane protein 165-like n=1 Tax=Ruditapes philippinarum TaxID=129788 RepID=UPI00295C1ADF|nr:transmembrane protein 165-like [Ruditapes philippinarum]